MLIRELRSAGCEAPILVITAQATIDARVSGLEGGADDYFVKPFHQAEFLGPHSRPFATAVFAANARYAGRISQA